MNKQLNINNEEWKAIKGFPNYYVSNYGRIQGPKKILKNQYTRDGYAIVSIRRHTMRVHRIVADTFLPNINKGLEVNHIDGNKKNNRVDNLEWVSHDENMKHASRTGLLKTVLTKEDIKHIVFEYKEGKTIQELAKRYGVCDGCIYKYVRSYIRNKNPKIPKEIKRAIKELYQTGKYTQKELSKIFRVGHGTVGKAIHEN